MNFQFNLRIIKFVYEDILILYARFGYNEFLGKDTRDMKLRYTLKKLSNEAVIGHVGKVNGIIRYKLSKYVVENCQKFERRHG